MQGKRKQPRSVQNFLFGKNEKIRLFYETGGLSFSQQVDESHP